MGELERWSKRLLSNLPYRRIQRASSFQERIIIAVAISTPREIEYSLKERPSSQRALVAPGFQPGIFVLPLVSPQVRESTIPASLLESQSIENDAYYISRQPFLLPQRKAPRTTSLTACEPG
jgi:hypothetical protein